MLGWAPGELFVKVHQVGMPEVNRLGAVLDEVVERPDDRLPDRVFEEPSFAEIADQVGEVAGDYVGAEFAASMRSDRSRAA